jgi:cytidylate kinase/molybdenum cofactor biosynthesis enzyme MoaA
MIPSVNFHLWEPCNMRCKFCFATFQDVKHSILPKGHLPKDQAIEVVTQLSEIGFEKITFAGGEPTLCPWLPELIKKAKEAGLTTMIVTNGSKLTNEFLVANKEYLDWIAISIDSLNPETNVAMGRAITGRTPLTLEYYLNLTDRIKQYGYDLKINTVVTNKNFSENLSELIEYLKPKRWKILQVLPIEGQNDNEIDSFTINQKQFLRFVDTHKKLENITNIIPETNGDMKGSYAMVDPAGRFYDNAKGKHNYSRPILEVGARIAIQQVDYDFDKFIERGGIYDWKTKKSLPTKLTLSGCVASGKTTIGKLLAKELQYNFISIGNRTREIAEEKGMTIVEFQKYCLANPEMDIQLDQEFSTECNRSESLVIDYRLGFKFIKNAYHIFLKISEATAVERLKKANRAKESYATINERNESFKSQFINSYGVDYTMPKNYDLIFDVETFQSPEEIIEHILREIGHSRNTK